MFPSISVSSLFSQLMIIYMGQGFPSNTGSQSGNIYQATLESYSMIEGVI